MSMSPMRIGQVIKSWRRLNNISIQAAAKQIGISSTVLHRVELGIHQGTNRASTRVGKGLGTGSGMDGATLAKMVVWLLGTEKMKQWPEKQDNGTDQESLE